MVVKVLYSRHHMIGIEYRDLLWALLWDWLFIVCKNPFLFVCLWFPWGQGWICGCFSPPVRSRVVRFYGLGLTPLPPPPSSSSSKLLQRLVLLRAILRRSWKAQMAQMSAFATAIIGSQKQCSPAGPATATHLTCSVLPSRTSDGCRPGLH